MNKEDNVISIEGLQYLLTPVAIIIAGFMVSTTMFFTLRNGVNVDSSTTLGATDTTTTTTTTTDTADVAVEVTLAKYADQVGVDKDKFDKCYAAADQSEIDKDVADGTAAGVSGTPGFVLGNLSDDGTVTGYRISGAYPYEDFELLLTAVEKGEVPVAKYDFDQDGVLDEWPTSTASIDDDHFRGDRGSSKLAIVEFSDFECPFCQRHFQQTYPSIVSNFVDNGKAIYVYRDFPLNFHPKAIPAAIAANCVAEQGGTEAYFEMHDLMYANGL